MLAGGLVIVDRSCDAFALVHAAGSCSVTNVTGQQPPPFFVAIFPLHTNPKKFVRSVTSVTVTLKVNPRFRSGRASTIQRPIPVL